MSTATTTRGVPASHEHGKRMARCGRAQPARHSPLHDLLAIGAFAPCLVVPALPDIQTHGHCSSAPLNAEGLPRLPAYVCTGRSRYSCSRCGYGVTRLEEVALLGVGRNSGILGLGPYNISRHPHGSESARMGRPSHQADSMPLQLAHIVTMQI